MLSEMDGFKSKDSQVVFLAATNLPDALDPALVRPGRLERQIHMGLPDRRGRRMILEVHARNRPIEPAVDLAAYAARTPGMSGAQLARVVNEACMEAVRRNLNTVDPSCFEAGLATVAMGRARQSAIISDKDRQTTAWHEAGHVVSAMTTPGAPPPVAVSILPRGQAGGVTWMSGDDDQYLSRSAAHAQLTVLLGGRAAEELLHGDDFTSGASNDLERATHLAVAMITRYGMTDLGLVVRTPDLPTGAEDSAITVKAESLLSDARAAASQAIADNRGLFDAVVAELLDRETLDETDLAAIQARFEMDRDIVMDAADVPDICVGD
jgi:cell division protease FtsH